MNIFFSSKAWNDYIYWQDQNKKIVKRINDLSKAIQREPYDGVGKPERLRFELSDCYSRRIDQEHRLVYRITDNVVHILACRFHYQ